MRLSLLERQVQDVSMKNWSSLSSSAYSVIVSIRCNLLRALEKPLRNLDVPELSKHGIVCRELVVSVQCNYYTFREIAHSLAIEHKCDSYENNKKRVAFSPSFNTTQSGSTASNNMNIIFACLADLSAFLRVRDDRDFEGILSKEVVSETSTLLRVLGTLVIDTNYDNYLETASQTKSTNSVSASSEVSPTLSIFFRSAPVKYSQY